MYLLDLIFKKLKRACFTLGLLFTLRSDLHFRDRIWCLNYLVKLEALRQVKVCRLLENEMSYILPFSNSIRKIELSA